MRECGSCEFFVPVSASRATNSKDGQCRRMPPRPTRNSPSSYPSVSARNDWCGEYREHGRVYDYEPMGVA